jgi:hypothetical protein
MPVELSKELLSTAGWDEINSTYASGQEERNKQRLSILSEENNQLLSKGIVDNSLQGDIEKQESNITSFGGVPKETGIDVNLKPVDYNKVVSKTVKDTPLEDSQLETMSHSELQALRMKNKEDKEFNIKLAPYEHRAYAREAVTENPTLAPLFASLLIPGYQAAKAVGLDVSATEDPTTPVSGEQMKQGYIGVGEGLARFASKELFELLGIEITK